jgi:peptide/nickel transport system substrate-binding protein
MPKTLVLGIRWLVVVAGAAVLLVLTAACGTETIEVPGETVVVKEEVIKEVQVPGKTVVVEKEVVTVVVTEEVVKEVQVPGETVVVTEEVVKEVQVPGETVVVTEEVVKEVQVPGETVVVEVPVPGETVVVEVPVRAAASTLTVAYTHLGAPTGLPANQTGLAGEVNPWSNGVAEKLVRRQEDLSWAPDLAQSYELASDFSKITVTLRKGISWHGGYGEFTAEDVKFSYGDAGLENPDSIHGSVAELRTFLEPLVVVDDYTIELPLKESTIAWEEDVLFLVNIHSKTATEALGREAALQSMIGTGPFKTVSWIADNEFRGEAVANHWRHTPHAQTLRIIQVPEAFTRVAALQTGEVDIVENIPFSFAAKLKDAGFESTNKARGGRQQAFSFGGNYLQKKYHDRDEPVRPRPGFKPDDQHPWIGDPDDPVRSERARKVRWAMSLAIDRELINEEILLGQGRLSYVPYFSPFLPEHPDRWTIPYDPDRARQLLQEAGYAKGFEVPIHLMPGNPRMTEPGYEAVATMWATELGLTPRFIRTAYGAFRPNLVERKVDMLFSFSAGNELDTFDIPRKGLVTASTWSEGDYNWGIEVVEGYDTYSEAQAAINDRAARVRANLEIGDFYHETQLATAFVDMPVLYYFDPDRVAKWDLLPGRINGFETVVLK